MQQRVIISTVPVVTSTAKPQHPKKIIVKVSREDISGGIYAEISAYAVQDLTVPRRPVIGYEVKTPNLMSANVTDAELSSLEGMVNIPTGITSINERCAYFDLAAVIIKFVNDPGGAMFGLNSNQWDIIEVDNDI